MYINLLPEQEITRAIDRNEIIRRSLYGLASAFALIALLYIVFAVNMKIKRSRFVNLESKYQNYIDLRNEVQTLKEDIYSLNKGFGLINESLFKKFFWSEKLLNISEIMPDELWLNSIKIGRGNEIKLQGFLLPVSTEERPIAVLSRFMRRLQENKEFFKDFSEVSLVDVRSVSAKDKEIFEFNIALKIKE